MKKINNKNYLIAKNKSWIILMATLILVELCMCISIVAINLVYPSLKNIVFVIIVIFTVLLIMTAILFISLIRLYKKALIKEDSVSASFNDDIMNPLCAIRSNLQTAISVDDINKIKEILGDTLQESKNLTSLMDKLMLIRNAYFGHLDYNFEKANLTEFVENLAMPYYEYADLQNKTLTVNHTEELEPVYFDKDKIREILINLLDNSFKYTKHSDKISIIMSLVDDNLIIKVIDSGIGVSEYEIKDIFEKFYQTKNAKAVNPSGNGLGLTIAYYLTIGMNGTIVAEKNFPKGLKVTLSVPCRKFNTF